MKRAAMCTPTVLLSSILHHLALGMDSVVLRHTIRIRLADSVLESRRPLRHFPLILQQRQCHLDWFRSQASWTQSVWRNVIFSDESGFSPRWHFSAIGICWAIKSPGAFYQKGNAQQDTAKLSQESLQEYNALSWPARSPDLSSIEHVTDVLGESFQPFWKTDELVD